MVMQRDARFDHSKRYRYFLSRVWHPGKPKCMFLMMNPSTADANIDDHTIKRCIAYAMQWGYGGFVVGNLFALRSTDPKELLRDPRPVGKNNDKELKAMAKGVNMIVAAWGDLPTRLKGREKEVMAMFEGQLHYLKLSKKGDAPLHPSRLSQDLTPLPWRPKEKGASK